MHREYITKFVELQPRNRLDGAVLSSIGNIDKVGDIIAPGAFDDFIGANERLLMLRGHNADQIIGQWKNIRLDDDLLRADGEILAESQVATETKDLIDKKLISGVSIGFNLADAEWQWRDEVEDGYQGDGIIFSRIGLKEASIVTFPANDSAGIGKREELRGPRMSVAEYAMRLIVATRRH